MFDEQSLLTDGGRRINRSQDIDQWFHSLPGSLLLEQEQSCLDGILSNIFGYYLLQVGSVGDFAVSSTHTHLRSRVMVTPELPRASSPGWITARPAQLPIASDSVDAVLLVHTLDFLPDPHQILREVDRILIPGGRLMVTGFNPWSLWGLRRLMGRTSPPWSGRFISQHRVIDWLSLLGFEIEKTTPLMFRPPLRQRGLMERLKFLESAGERWWPALGGVYVVKAVKLVSTITPVKPVWKFKRRILAGGAIEPSARSSNG